MAGPTEFSLEAVRQYMLGREGRVTNHELVKHFRKWLTHPTDKEVARRKFKEYVNTLATIRQDNDEKYLVLKEKFFPKFDDYDDNPEIPVAAAPPSTSLLDEVMACYAPVADSRAHVPRRQLPPTPVVSGPPPHHIPGHRGSYTSGNTTTGPPSVQRRNSGSSGRPQVPPPPYRPPPPSQGRGPPLPSDYGLPTPRQGVYHPPLGSYSAIPPQLSSVSSHSLTAPPASQPPGYGGAPPLPSRRDSSSSMSSQGLGAPPSPYISQHLHSSGMRSALPPPLPSKSSVLHGSQSSLATSSTRSSHGNISRNGSRENEEASPPYSRRSDPVTSAGSSGGSSDAEVADSSTTVSSNQHPPIKNQDKISVKERTKTFNRMASQVELNDSHLKPINSVSAAAVKRRNSRTQESRRGSSAAKDDDTSSISTLDQTAKQWMVRAAQGDYHSMVKMLREDPRLAKHKDFVSGYTALHWAAKHGNLDMVKTLAGSYNADVNQKSHGGYTALHLACQFGHQEVFDILVKVYRADPNLRDNSGKKPRQYMVVQDQAVGLSLSNDTVKQLKDRRRHRRQAVAGGSKAGSSGSGILRFGSLSVKVKKTTEAFNNYFNNKNDASIDYSMGGGGIGSGPNSLPPIMDNVVSGVGENGSYDLPSSGSDTAKMPPPKFPPPSSSNNIKKRKSKRPNDYYDYGGKVRSAPSTPTSRSPIKEEVLSSGTRCGNGSDSDSEYGFDSHWGGSVSRHH